MARSELYNLMWLPHPPGPEEGTPVAREESNKLAKRRSVPALILYPALATAGVSVGDEPLEILLLVHRDFELKPEDVNLQLKVTRGLDASKRYGVDPLFETVTDDQIEVGGPSNLSGDVLRTKSSAFVGVLDSRIVDFYKKWKMTQVYQVTLDPACLRAPSGTTRELNMRVGSSIAPREIQDDLIGEIFKELKVEDEKLPQDGKYAFQLAGDGVDISKADVDNPIQAFHPVARFENLEYATIGHASDVHVSSRQNVMARSNARVIDYASRGGEADQGEVPPIGKIINVCSADIKNILDQMGRSVDVMILGGDLVDYMRNVWADPAALSKASEVWQRVDLGDEYKVNYRRFVDFISVYSLVLDFYRSHGRPLFALTGNHDAYAEPYGISPRVLGRRANEGIPADHNLTLYEAILCFGETYKELKKSTFPISPMQTDLFRWFYGVLTPWADGAVRLPKQHLVALAWGDEEDILDVPLTNHGFGHLPRSDEGISGKQLAVLEEGIGSGRKVILTTHFTFVSYKEQIATTKDEDGDVEFTSWGEYSDYDMGTFETNREKLYEQYLGNDRKIQVVLTGHSHRRALYLVTDVSYFGDNSVKTRAFDFPEYAAARQKYSKAAEPAIIVSDSAGSIPRENQDGEFDGWGSAPPAGTRVQFAADGSIHSIEAVRAPVAPRIAVALDYVDLVGEEPPWWKKLLMNVPVIGILFGEKRVISRFQSGEISSESEIRPSKRKPLEFEVKLEEELADKWGLRIEGVAFYGLPSGGSWEKVELSRQGDGSHYRVRDEDFDRFRLTFPPHKDRGIFLSVKVGCEGPRSDRFRLYDFDSHWNFECKVSRGTGYEVERRRKEAEIPDFSWRRRLEKYQ